MCSRTLKGRQGLVGVTMLRRAIWGPMCRVFDEEGFSEGTECWLLMIRQGKLMLKPQGRNGNLLSGMLLSDEWGLREMSSIPATTLGRIVFSCSSSQTAWISQSGSWTRSEVYRRQWLLYGRWEFQAILHIQSDRWMTTGKGRLCHRATFVTCHPWVSNDFHFRKHPCFFLSINE